jgi:hypothetical protein
MVALAPSTTETSPWHILNGFPKLHSRARETKTRPCTEAATCKSLNRVEIRQVIYDSRIRLESFSRDPIGFKGSEWNLYEYCESCPLVNLDPSGEAIWVPIIGCCAACVACGLCLYDWPDHWLPSAFCWASCGVCGVCGCKIEGLGKPKGAPPKSKR